MQDSRQAAEIVCQRQLSRVWNCFAQIEKLGGRGAAKAVDRLFEVADEEQAAGVETFAADQLHKLDLQRVGVLKFIHEQQAEVGGKLAPERGIFRIREQAVGQCELV